MSFLRQIRGRFERVAVTFVSKRYLVWVWITYLFCKYGIDRGWWVEYLGFTAVVFGFDLAKQHLGVRDGQRAPEAQPAGD